LSAAGLALPEAESVSRASAPEPGASTSEAMRVELDGFEGPLDLLLDLARRQQVDLARISLLTLVDQYVATIDRLGLAAARLERAADWLVMASWLTWLKSRLLLAKDSEEAHAADRAAGILMDRLAQMERVRTLAAWLEARPQLGRDTYARGATAATARAVAPMQIVALFEACLVGLRWVPPSRQSYAPPRQLLWRVPDAIARLRSLLGSVPDGATLGRFLPRHLFAVPVPASLAPRTDLPLQRRGAVASTLLGALELAREAHLQLRQDEPFGPILVQPAPGGEDVASPAGQPAQAA